MIHGLRSGDRVRHADGRAGFLREGVHQISGIGFDGPWILVDWPPRIQRPPFDGWGPDTTCRPVNFAAVPTPYCPLGCVGGCKMARRVSSGRIDETLVTTSPDCKLIPGSVAEHMARDGTLPPGGVWVGLGTAEDIKAHKARIARKP